MKLNFTSLILLIVALIALSTNEGFGQKKKDAVATKVYVSPYYNYDDDKDGVPNYRDKCPGTPKSETVTPFGCPMDTDFDLTYDYEDSCKTEVGPKNNHGCPVVDLDTDGDKVLDKDDRCPEVAGILKNKGCPELKEEEKQAILEAFENLLFETGKDIIQPSSFPSLNKLASVLINNPQYKLILEGHTDNVGDDEKNMQLSHDRSFAVKKYLAEKGVSQNRIDAQWYGETKPKDTNDTPEGRKLNRRVEMNIVF